MNELRIHALTRGARVVRGYAIDDPHRPYHAWRDALRLAAIEGRIDLDDVPMLQAIAPDLPDLVREAGVITRPGREMAHLPPALFQRRMHENIAEAAACLPRSGQPVVVLLDDLQWAYAGLQPLRCLWPAIAGMPLLVVGCYRSDERPDLATDFPEAEHLELGRLDPQAIAELSLSMLGDAGNHPALIDLLQRETEGNVYFLVEMLRALAEDAGRLEAIGSEPLPEHIYAGGVEELVQRRLQRVPGAERRILKLAALAGRDLDLKILRRAAPHIKWDEWLETCAEASVLVYEEGAWAFAHDKLREYLRKRINARERAELARRLAEAYAQVYPGLRASFTGV
jgi:predicted ATPase